MKYDRGKCICITSKFNCIYVEATFILYYLISLWFFYIDKRKNQNIENYKKE